MTIQQLALRKALLGLVVLLTAPGVPMLYAGQEFGDDGARTIDFLPVAWERLNSPLHRTHFETVKRLIGARRQIAALRSDAIQFEQNDFATEKVVRFRRWSDEGVQVVVALNFDSLDKTLTVNLPHGGLWQELMSGRVEEFVGGLTEIRLRAWEGVVFVPQASRAA
jgi:1,4-alpha-glucan branching enzyme